LGAAGAVLLASSALAADVAFLPPPPVWTGFYCGAGGGYDWGKFDIDNHVYNNLVEDFGANPPNSSSDPHWSPVTAEANGPFGTVICGYDHQIDPLFVVGVSSDYDFQDKRGRFEHSNEDVWHIQGATFQGQRWDVSVGNMGTIAGRAGVLVKPDLLVFGIVGWSWASASIDYFHGCEPINVGCGGANNHLGGSGTKMLNGPTVGFGMEALLGSNWSGRAEYRFTSLGTMSVNSVLGNGETQWTATTNARITDQSIRATLVYRP
jgi:outer membrane immunogenic protein